MCHTIIFIFLQLIFFFSFERSDTQKFEVPRMLFDEPQDLEKYILKSKDRYLFMYTMYNVCILCVLYPF